MMQKIELVPSRMKADLKRQRRQQGFTLIELMVVIVIIAILAAIAYPSYQDSVRKARRSDAQAAMLEIANFMERQFTEKNSYAGVTIAATGITTDFYTFTDPIPDLTVTSYTLTAVPQGAQANDSCGTLTLSQTGAKGADATGCW